MATETLQKYEEFRSFFTYENVLTYALALTDETNFVNDPDKWYEAVYYICQKYRDQIPELQWVYFTHRDPIPPQSEQVDQLIKLLSNSREASLPNPEFPAIVISKDKRELIKRREERRLSKYQTQVEAISKLLKDKLTVKAA